MVIIGRPLCLPVTVRSIGFYPFSSVVNSVGLVRVMLLTAKRHCFVSPVVAVCFIQTRLFIGNGYISLWQPLWEKRAMVLGPPQLSFSPVKSPPKSIFISIATFSLLPIWRWTVRVAVIGLLL